MPSSHNPVYNGLNLRNQSTIILSSLDKLEEVVYNSDLTPSERGNLVQQNLGDIKGLVQTIANTSAEDIE